jgi:hypothetical protein
LTVFYGYPAQWTSNFERRSDMLQDRPALRIASFIAALAATFVIAFVVGREVGPDLSGQPVVVERHGQGHPG